MKKSKLKIRTFEIKVPACFDEMVKDKKDYIKFLPIKSVKYYKLLDIREMFTNDYRDRLYEFVFEKLQNRKSICFGE